MDTLMRSRERLSLVAVSAVVLGVALVAGQYLAAEAWSAGALGFPLLLSLPALWALSQAFEVDTARLLSGATALALMLIGLDVVDSSRSGVAVTGWLVAAASSAVLLALLAFGRPAADRG